MNFKLSLPEKWHPRHWKITRPMRIMLIGMGVLLANVLLYHMISGYFTGRYLDEQSKALVTVSTIKVGYEKWQPTLMGVGTMRGSEGVDILTELDGIITHIYFDSGQHVKKGDRLVQLKADDDIAALRSLIADAKLAEATYQRDLVQSEFDAVSQETLDIDRYTWESQVALAAQQAAIVEKKTIRAPFSGRIGISTLNEGQYLDSGDFVVTLQSTHPLLVDFYVPEQKFPQIAVGQYVNLYVDTYPDQMFKGKITSIDTMIDPDTHNILVEATVPNPTGDLLAGMYAQVEIITGAPEEHLTIPQAAVSYNPYGNLVYVVRDKNKNEDEKKEKDQKQTEKNDVDPLQHSEHVDHEPQVNVEPPEKDDSKDNKMKPDLYVKQRFVTLGEMRGDQVVVLAGLKEGDEIVTSGQLKLKNNARISINNDVVPSNDANPDVSNDAK